MENINKTKFSFTYEDVVKVLDSEIGQIQKQRKLCGKCDNFNSAKHEGIYCTKCGGEFVGVSKWTVFNLLQRIKKHLSKGNHESTWLLSIMPYYYVEKHKFDNLSLEWFDYYKVLWENLKQVREFYDRYKKERNIS